MEDERDRDTTHPRVSAKLQASRDAIAKRRMQIVEHEKKLKARKAKLAGDYRRLKSMEREASAQQVNRERRVRSGQHYCIGKLIELLVLNGQLSADAVVGILKRRFTSDADLHRATVGLFELRTTISINRDRTAQRVMCGLAVENAVLHRALDCDVIRALAPHVLNGDDLKRACAGIERISATLREAR